MAGGDRANFFWLGSILFCWVWVIFKVCEGLTCDFWAVLKKFGFGRGMAEAMPFKTKQIPFGNDNKKAKALARRGWRVVGDGVELACPEEHTLHLLRIEGTPAATAEDGKLIAALVHRTIAVHTF
jgi:hypothetical protein